MTVAPAGSFVPNFAVIAFVVVAMGAMFAWGYSAYFAGADRLDAPGAVPTATQLSDEERFIATNTPVPPTNTPAVTAVPTKQATSASDSNRVQINYPTVTTTPESITFDNGNSGSSDGQSGSSQIDQAPQNANGDRSYSFYAVTDVDLLIVVDQVVVWQQPLVAGQATGYFDRLDVRSVDFRGRFDRRPRWQRHRNDHVRSRVHASVGFALPAPFPTGTTILALAGKIAISTGVDPTTSPSSWTGIGGSESIQTCPGTHVQNVCRALQRLCQEVRDDNRDLRSARGSNCHHVEHAVG